MNESTFKLRKNYIKYFIKVYKMEKVQIAKRYLIIGAAAFSIILVVSIIATYFGKSCSTELDDNELNNQCKPYMCKNPNLFLGKTF